MINLPLISKCNTVADNILNINGNIVCGISLIIDRDNSKVDTTCIKAMNSRIFHRGPNGEGYYFGEHFAMGHRRLSIIDLSEAGLQPMKKGNDYIIFNGMIYNYPELKEKLIKKGYTFNSQTDTEVLLAACQHWGLDAFNRLNGMWAFAWYKHDTNEIILCRDRYGIKPLYYTTMGNSFAAASEIKQFLPLPGFKPALNYSAAVNFLAKGLLNHSEDTFFEGVYELRGGHYLIYNLNRHKFSIHQWYNLETIAKPAKNISQADAVKEIKKLFDDSVNIRMRSDVKIGSCLSGGIDSSSIVSLVHSKKLGNIDFTTVTSCYADKKFDEQKYSDVVTEKTGFRAAKVYPDLNNLFDNGDLDAMLYHQDQPFNTASHYSEHQVFKKASENKITVMLDGQGADEYLCGYDDFFSTYMRQLLHEGKLYRFFRNMRLKSSHEKISIIKSLKNYCKTAYWYPFLGAVKPLLGKSEAPWLNPALNTLVLQHKKTFDAVNLRALSLKQMTYSSLPFQLHSEDRNAMMFSIESRLPFLDHRLVEFAIGMPDEFKIKNGYSKYIFREAIEEVPEVIRKRTHKMGFVAPDEVWVKENKVRVRRELLNAVMNTNIFSPQLLERFDKFIQGKLGYEPIYFRAITLNRFIKIFNMQLQSPAIATNKSIITTIQSSYKRA